MNLECDVRKRMAERGHSEEDVKLKGKTLGGGGGGEEEEEEEEVI
jgi:hypothetical protein